MGEIALAFEVTVLVFLGAAVCLGLAAAVGGRLRAIFSPPVRTTTLRILFGAIWMADGLLRFVPGTYSQLSAGTTTGRSSFQFPSCGLACRTPRAGGRRSTGR